MRVVFLQDDFPPQSFGGAGISTYELARGVKENGHEVFVITTCRKREEAGETQYHGLRVFKISSDYDERWRWYRSLYNRPVVLQVERILKEVRPDVVHVNNIHFYLSYHCLKLAKRYAKAVVITLRDVMSFNFEKLETKQYLENFDSRTTWIDHIKQARKRWNPLRNFFIRRHLKYANKIFAISKSLREALVQNGIRDVEVMHNGIDFREWCVDENTKNCFREKYNLGNKKILLFGGRLSESKGGTKVVEALPQICKEVSDAVLLIFGKVDEYAEIMKKQARTLGVEDALIFTDWIDRSDVKSAYAVSDIVLMPSICLDAFGRHNIEAMASKKPVVGTCYGGTPEIVVDGVTGYVVNPLHSREIAIKSIDLLKNPEKAEQFGLAGYERVRTEFNLNDKVEKYVHFYQSLSVGK